MIVKFALLLSIAAIRSGTEFFEIVPDYDLNLMSANQDLYDLSSRILLGLREIYQSLKPDLVFVHGVVTSTIAALASFYSKIQVAHVEAGLNIRFIVSIS